MELPFGLGSRTHMKFTSLIFFIFCCCSFVWRSEADCLTPQRGETSVLTDQAHLMDDFPEGSKVTLECRNGYVKEAGSDAIYCQGGKWTAIELVCKKFDCGVPQPQPNMIFNTSAGTLFGDIMTVSCDKGYQISGTSYKQCFPRGWLGRAQCHIRKCKFPAEVNNGKCLWASQDPPTYGESIKFECDEGFVLTGNSTIQCGETGEYNSPPPECKDISTTAAPTTTAAPPTTAAAAAAHKDKIITHNAEVTTRQEIHDKAKDSNKDVDHFPVIIGAVVVCLVVCIGAICLHRHFLKRKGSYNTREDLKPKLFLFQNA
nr:complement decay-accelerating factor, GPI-anchored-like [Nerophis lumbriciformis]